MLGVILAAQTLWRVLAATLVLGATLSSCDLPGWLQEGTSPAPPPSEAPSAAPEPDAPTQSGAAQVAVYMGWRNVSGVESFSDWLGTPVWAHDFLDHRQGWEAVADPRAQLEAWERWVTQSDDPRLVLSVPLLIDAAAGDHSGGAAGAYDQHFERLARALVDHGLENTVIRLGWEFNGNTFPWQVQPQQISDYKRFWSRVVGVMRAVPGAEFQFDWCPNITLDATGLPFAELYPGDDVVDIIGLGFYDYYWGHPKATPEARWAWLRDVDNGLADHRNFAARRNKPTSFPEYGLWEQGTSTGGGGDDPYFIQQLAAWIDAGNVAYHGYNNVDATADHRLDSYPEGREAYLEAFGG